MTEPSKYPFHQFKPPEVPKIPQDITSSSKLPLIILIGIVLLFMYFVMKKKNEPTDSGSNDIQRQEVAIADTQRSTHLLSTELNDVKTKYEELQTKYSTLETMMKTFLEKVQTQRKSDDLDRDKTEDK